MKCKHVYTTGFGSAAIAIITTTIGNTDTVFPVTVTSTLPLLLLLLLLCTHKMLISMRHGRSRIQTKYAIESRYIPGKEITYTVKKSNGE